MIKFLKRGMAAVLSAMMLMAVVPANTAATSEAAVSIPNSAKEYKGHYYAVYNRDNTTWNKAKQLCESKGGHLVTITTLGESLFVENLAAKYGTNYYWIGAYTKSNKWKWVTGESTSYKPYTGWPNAYSNRGCTLNVSDNSYLDYWGLPGSQSYYICEWDTTTAYVLPDQVKISSVSQSGPKAVTISWKKVSGAKGYSVYMKTGKKGSYKKIGESSKNYNSLYKDKLKKGQTYYFRVRAYKNIFGERSYGELSAEKKIKIK